MTPQQIRDLADEHARCVGQYPDMWELADEDMRDTAACLRALADAMEDHGITDNSALRFGGPYGNNVRWDDRIARHLRTAEETD